jgi:putative lipoprotein
MPRALHAHLLAFALLAASPAALGADSDPWIARDKALHFDASAGLAALAYAVSAGWIVDARWKAIALGGGVALAAGAGKEALDAAGVFRGDPSWKDFAWDVAGTVAGLALAWGADLLLGGVTRERPALASPPASAAFAVRF